MKASYAWRIAAVTVAVVVLCCPPASLAQDGSSITGVVRDTSGGVLPGVTVEAASPALIEKVRITVTDSQGLYRLVDLRPGSYTLTFTLPGFRTLRREGLALPASFTATVNADMSVGAVEETVTVTAEVPLVDTQSIRQQAQFERETLESLPGTGRLTGLTNIIPAATQITPTSYSVGGVSDTAQNRFTTHGAPASEPVVDGANQIMGGLVFGVFIYNQLTFQEVVVETSGIGADRETGGVQVNIVQRDGGNTFSGGATYSYTGPRLEGNNLTDELLARGLPETQVGSLNRYYDFGVALGGPIKRDRLWFFSAFRSGITEQIQQGNFYNAQQGTLFYEPDESRPAIAGPYSKDFTLRMTGQVQRHRLVLSTSFQPNCNCPFGLFNSGAVLPAPEAVAQHHYNPQNITTVRWTFPGSNRILLEAGATTQVQHQSNKRPAETSTSDIQVTEQATSYRYGARALNIGNTGSYIFLPRWQYQGQAAVSYLTGAHNFKTGFSYRYFATGNIDRNSDPNQINQARDYTFRDRVPVSVRIWAVPFAWEDYGRDIGFFIQDQWTIQRATLNLGVRYNDVSQSFREGTVAAGPFVGERRLPAVNNVPHWPNINPRVGVAYDLFGAGQTALKASLGRYNPAIRTTGQPPPAHSMTPNTSRSWNDANRNYVPDCDLLNPSANGECGPWSNLTFGQVTGTDLRQAPDAIGGLNRQDHNWQGSVSVQHELRPGMGLNVGYYRTWYGGFLVNDNLAVTPADYDEYCITVPTDSRLPNSGEQLCGLYDISPARFGLVDNLQTQASNYGDRTRVYNGVDVTMNARFGQGGHVQGGLSVGRTVEDDCLVVDSPQDARAGFCKVVPPWSAGTQLKFMVVYPLPWDLQTSVIYQNFAGVNQDTTIVVSNAQIAPSLGRSLAGGARNVTMELVPPQTLFEPRLQQLDVRFTRIFRIERFRLRGNFDIYNIFNASNVLNLNRRYGGAWLDAVQIMGGRLMKVGVQLDF